MNGDYEEVLEKLVRWTIKTVSSSTSNRTFCDCGTT